MFQLDRLRLGRARFVLQAEDTVSLPPYLGSTLRGALGYALGKSPEAHAYCFQTNVSRQTDRLRKNEALPHPFLIEPPLVRTHPWQRHDRLEFSILFVGRGLDFFADFVQAIQLMARDGLGRDRIPFTLERVQNDLGNSGQILWLSSFPQPVPLPSFTAEQLLPTLPEGCSSVQLLLETPLRLLQDNRLVKELTFRSFIRSLLARLSSLLYFHCDTELQLDFAQILEQTNTTQISHSQLHIGTLSRWSNRQHQNVPLDGYLGQITWQGPSIRILLPLIAAGTLFHLGKSTVLGLGKYAILPTT